MEEMLNGYVSYVTNPNPNPITKLIKELQNKRNNFRNRSNDVIIRKLPSHMGVLFRLQLELLQNIYMENSLN
jgi:hypothetical protein